MVTIKDVAEAAGVSTATVSRVLADKPYIRPEIRERVLAAVDQLNYRPNRVARSLRSQQSHTIGLIVSDIQNRFFTLVSRAVEDAAYAQGMAVFLCNTDEQPDKEALYLNLMCDENVAGLILSPTLPTADAFAEAVQLDLPVVVIDRRIRGADVDSVLLDNVEAAYRLVEHLIADGHRRIAAVFGAGSTTARERREGFMRALKNHDLKLVPDLVSYVDAREEEGYHAVMRFLSLPERPDAIFTSNGLLATGAFRALRDSRVAIPDEVAFATFDETSWTPLVDPPVSVVEQPTYEIGRMATELLLKRLADPNRPTAEVMLKGKLVVRSSCGRHLQRGPNPVVPAAGHTVPDGASASPPGHPESGE